MRGCKSSSCSRRSSSSSCRYKSSSEKLAAVLPYGAFVRLLLVLRCGYTYSCVSSRLLRGPRLTYSARRSLKGTMFRIISLEPLMDAHCHDAVLVAVCVTFTP